MLILDASKEFKTGRAQNELLPEHVAHIHGWYHAYQDVEGVARVVTLEEIAANDYNLNIPRYVEPKVEQEVADGGGGDAAPAGQRRSRLCR